MKKSQLTAVAERIGTSSSAVSKALNHCPGLGDELRERILDAAAAEGVHGRRAACDVYVILPDTPTYFWRTFHHALGRALAARGLTAKYNVYTMLGNRAAVERYLDEAEAMTPAVLLIAAHYDGLAARLSAMASHRFVVSMIEPADATNVFFVGSDQRADGRMLYAHVREDLPSAHRVLLLVPFHAEERLAGFAEAADMDCHIVRVSGGESAAELARILNAMHRTEPTDAVICMNGNTQTVCMALKKCRLTLPVYGFEKPPIDSRYPLPVGEAVQDLEGIAAALSLMAERYVRERVCPSAKYLYVASQYIRRHREG